MKEVSYCVMIDMIIESWKQRYAVFMLSQRLTYRHRRIAYEIIFLEKSL